MKTNTFKINKYRGVTLIEMMTVVGIMAILAAIAIPSYTAYSVRAKVSEAVATVSPIQHSFSDTFVQTGSLIQATSAAASDASGVGSKYVSSIALGTCTLGTEATCGEITVTLNGANIGIGGSPTIKFKAQQLVSGAYAIPVASSNSPVDWACVSSTSTAATAMSPIMLVPAALGTLDPKYAPTQCK